ncbi:MAG: putative metal-dependent hydrolase [Acidobacteria bacterium]|nr:putative metal-dependent hydrolase [Acidobacteriota bacterium]
MSNEIDPRYPIGKFRPATSISSADRSAAVKVIADLPEQLRNALKGLDEAQKNTPYRDGGWTVRQVVHHLADSHMTAFQRIRRALTEEMPIVPGYSEKAFAALADSTAPTDWSVDIISGLHARWSMLLGSLTDDQWMRSYQHMERGPSTIEAATLLYAWHCKHHVAHITELRSRMGW